MIGTENQPAGSATHPADSTMWSAAPKLSSRGLTTLLLIMCTVPVITIAVLWAIMPPVFPQTLSAEFALVDVPPQSYYDDTALEDRTDFPNAVIVVTNTGDQAWTHLNLRINKGMYQIYESGKPVEPGEERSFMLSRFVHRSGASFKVGINRPTSVELYARLPDKSRGTYEGDLN